MKQSCLCAHFCSASYFTWWACQTTAPSWQARGGSLSSFCLDVLRQWTWLLMTNNTNNYSNSNHVIDCHLGCLQWDLYSNSPFWMPLVLLFLCKLFSTLNLFPPQDKIFFFLYLAMDFRYWRDLQVSYNRETKTVTVIKKGEIREREKLQELGICLYHVRKL